MDPHACVYLQMEDGENIIFLEHVDYLLLVTSSLQAIDMVMMALRERFEMKDLGEAEVILGLEMSCDMTHPQAVAEPVFYSSAVDVRNIRLQVDLDAAGRRAAIGQVSRGRLAPSISRAGRKPDVPDGRDAS